MSVPVVVNFGHSSLVGEGLPCVVEAGVMVVYEEHTPVGLLQNELTLVVRVLESPCSFSTISPSSRSSTAVTDLQDLLSDPSTLLSIPACSHCVRTKAHELRRARSLSSLAKTSSSKCQLIHLISRLCLCRTLFPQNDASNHLWCEARFFHTCKTKNSGWVKTW